MFLTYEQLKDSGQIEPNSLVQGDCLEVMRFIPDGSVDMILADLPYGTTACKWDSVIPFEPLWEHYKRVIKSNGVVVLTGSQPFTTDLINSNREWFRYDWVWNKVSGANFFNLKNRPFKTHEDVLIFAPTPNFVFNPIRTMRTSYSLKRNPVGRNNIIKKTRNTRLEVYGTARASADTSVSKDGTKHPVDIITFNTAEKGRYKFRHATKKPVALFDYLIRTYTDPGQLVLDNVAGSGTTAVAAAKAGRQWICIEKEAEYCQIIQKRISQVT